MTKHCNGSLMVSEQSELTISSHDFSVIPNGLNCTLHLTTAPYNQVLTSLLYLHTEESHPGACDLNRLDFYDGSKVNQSEMLSRKCVLYAYVYAVYITYFFIKDRYV